MKLIKNAYIIPGESFQGIVVLVQKKTRPRSPKLPKSKTMRPVSKMEDKQLTCATCGSDFTFTGAEQEFYLNKGFQEPKKCKPCRDAAKNSRGGGGGYGGGGGGGYGGGGGGGARQLYDAVCAGCGVQTQVPFQPKGSKPVYCRDCFNANRSYSGGGY